MDKRLLSLTSQDIERILKKMNFKKSRTKGNHIQFIGVISGSKKRVTLIANQSHFTAKTIKSMIGQSGLNEYIWLTYL